MPRPNAGQFVKMTVLVPGQIFDPDTVSHFPEFLSVLLAKFFFVLFMDGRQLLVNHLTLTFQI